ncbi:uncharacterized protein LOC113290691 [Papaver somniferum]|uniref:uncharacterized protein LOC113290691 n=1 Tax=Papaver somniferum TaxID=3469 RepID=UPI000E6FDD7C|nr:uncharacterized protein LOC113290691 [Papaver somniferum]
MESVVKFVDVVSGKISKKDKSQDQILGSNIESQSTIFEAPKLLKIAEENNLQNSTITFANGSNGKVTNEVVKVTSWEKLVEKEMVTGMQKMVIHNSTSDNKGNIWLFWNASIKQSTIISMSNQMVTVSVGDVLVSDEKVGGRSPNRTSMLEFSECLDKCELLQAPKIGMQFCWSNCQQGSKIILCNLDRVVFNQKWLQKYEDWGYKVDLKIVSDHSPLLGGCANIPRPQSVPRKFQKMWISHPDFLNVVKESWAVEINGDPAYTFMKKLKEIKRIINDWNWKVFGNVHVKLKEAEEKVMEAMQASDSNPFDSEAFDVLVAAQNDHANREVQVNTLMRQKSRMKWIKEGAANTSFFHTNLKNRSSSNLISELEDSNGNVISDQDQIADCLVNHFRKRLKNKVSTSRRNY